MDYKTNEEWAVMLQAKIVELNKNLELLKLNPVKNKDCIYTHEQTIKEYSYYISQK